MPTVLLKMFEENGKSLVDSESKVGNTTGKSLEIGCAGQWWNTV